MEKIGRTRRRSDDRADVAAANPGNAAAARAPAEWTERQQTRTRAAGEWTSATIAAVGSVAGQRLGAVLHVIESAVDQQIATPSTR